MKQLKKKFIFKYEKYLRKFRWYHYPDGIAPLIFDFWTRRFENRFYWGTKYDTRPSMERRNRYRDLRLSIKPFHIRKRYLPHIRYSFDRLLYQKVSPRKPRKIGPNYWRNFKKKGYPALIDYYKEIASRRAHQPKVDHDITIFYWGWKVILFDLRQKTIYGIFAAWWTFLIAVLYYQEIFYIFSCGFLNFHKQYSDYFWSTHSIFLYDKVTGPIKVKTVLVFTIVWIFNLAYWTYLSYYWVSLQLRRTASKAFLMYGILYFTLFFLFWSFAGESVIGQYFLLVQDQSELKFETYREFKQNWPKTLQGKSNIGFPYALLQLQFEVIWAEIVADCAQFDININTWDDFISYTKSHTDLHISDVYPTTLGEYLQCFNNLVDVYNSYSNIHFKSSNSHIVDFLRVNILVQMEQYHYFVVKCYSVLIVILYLPVFLYVIETIELTNFTWDTKRIIRQTAYRYVWVVLALVEANFSDYLYFFKAIFIIFTLEVFIFFFTFINIIHTLLAKILPIYY